MVNYVTWSKFMNTAKRMTTKRNWYLWSRYGLLIVCYVRCFYWTWKLLILATAYTYFRKNSIYQYLLLDSDETDINLYSKFAHWGNIVCFTLWPNENLLTNVNVLQNKCKSKLHKDWWLNRSENVFCVTHSWNQQQQF